MCGIVGIVSRNKIDSNLIAIMTDTLHHRGPNASGIFVSEDGNVQFGHTRLSIIDLSEAANQPFSSPDGRYVLVFNGEIYNFKSIRKMLITLNPSIQFITHSDTEVLLHAFIQWGLDIAEKIEGMFAVAVYDTVLKKTFLIRDRKGKKPIFYYWDHEQFIFASEIKSILMHPAVSAAREIDTQAIHEFLHLGYIPEPKTIYRSIRKFPSGSIGEICNNLSFSVRHYWKVEDYIDEKPFYKDLKTFREELTIRLNNAVEKRLVSDVPLGAFLSGGTDSSLVVAIANKLSPTPLKTFCIGFKESKYDEHRYAGEVAKHLKTDHHEYILSERDASGMIESYLDHFDEPFADTSAIPTMLVSKMARRQVTVALTGDGGDELFLGYGSYTWANRFGYPLFSLYQNGIAEAFKFFGTGRLKRIGKLLEKVDRSILRSHIFSQEQYFFSSEEIRNQLLLKNIDYEEFRFIDSDRVQHLTEGEKQAIFDFQYYLKDDLLVKIDRASMFFGLECRCPLLDNDVIKFALNAPESLKKKGKINKWIVKDLLEDYIPKDLINRPKWGFSIPLAQWMKNELSYLMDYLSEEQILKIGLFNPQYVRALVDSFYKGEEYLYNRLWIIIIIQRFLLKNA